MTDVRFASMYGHLYIVYNVGVNFMKMYDENINNRMLMLDEYFLRKLYKQKFRICYLT